jgi:hypothetical protein
MKVSIQEWKPLQIPVLVFVAVVVVSVFSVYYTHQSLGEAQQRLAKEESVLNEARSRYQKSGEERDTIVRYLPEYQRLQKEGFVGFDARVNWVDGLRIANSGADLYGVDYELGPQTSFREATAPASSQLPIQHSIMRIIFKLLHEEDLMRFVGELRKQRVGLFALNNCMLERVSTSSALQNDPTLRAECELSWITMNPSNPVSQPAQATE